MAETNRGIVKQKKDFIWLIKWGLRGLKKDASDDTGDDAMHTTDEAAVYQ